MNEHVMVEDILRKADIEVGGSDPWDIQIHDEGFYRRVIADGALGLGESYMEEWWDAERVDLFIERVLRVIGSAPPSVPDLLLAMKARLFNLQSRNGAHEVAAVHYDLDSDLYASFLDPYMQYSCGYFKDTEDLNVAQLQKMDLICRKLHLQKGERLLDIGCGWGGLLQYAAQRYGIEGVGVTISEAQATLARERVKGLPVEIRLQDYRDITGRQFDKIVSVGMLEHVGYKNYRPYFETAERLMKKDGLFLLHTIGQNLSGITGNPWSDKYIFPNGMLPSVKQLGEAAEQLWVMEDWHNFGPYYHATLLNWDNNFNVHWPTLQKRYPEVFRRMFRYYFNSFAGAFKARKMQLWQVVWSRGHLDKVYESVR